MEQCFVLRDLQHARSANSTNSFGWTTESLAQLPPILVPGAQEVTDTAEKAEERGESWQQFDPGLKVIKVDSDRLTAEDPDFAYSLEILARADFTGNGVGDIAVLGCGNGRQSTWFACNYFIFSPTANGMLVRLTHDYAPYRMKVRIPD